ncbi:hypothetical protein [Vibrio crassostreae]|uniref:hypothetical protein n=1 Tax=Vibrio crassostreae TaxID=246167 RepID=UPI001051DB11|nr:hypothetical protein [Vibrio crassostreae]TCV23821.1 hypothetical protein EDB71_11232 [Vibrio crassostreae]CAK2141075.1 conserved exported hypothetical protein [Vibrio crassostreae]CAK2148949.1 conserved exported hypothetical protein [Vibrio crassostreae]CAK2165281.1 conserved exported hypothetical protein [Vibrio crassostreae]CAK2169872.1 conserved exported hypothetical protein [Vibrio crassostreae]
MVRNLVTFIVSLFFLSACSTTSNEQIDEKTLSNEDTLSNTIEEETNLNVIAESTDETNADLVKESNINGKTQTEPVEASQANATQGSASQVHVSKVTAKQVTEDKVETDNEKGLGSYLLLNNEPTKKVIKSLEGVTDTLNILTFGIFATGHG